MDTNQNREIERLITVIDRASQHARTIYYIYLGFISYSIVTVFGTTDRQLALKGDRADLPILNISVPLQGFFLVAPIIAIGLFIYFILYHYRLNTLIADLENIASSFNKRNLYPWMINIAREPDVGTIGEIQRIFVGLTLWFSLPITLFIFAIRYIKKHDEFSSYFIVGLAFVSLFVVFWFWNKFKNDKYKEIVEYASIPITIYLVAIIIIIIPMINDGYFKWTNLNLRNEVLITVPKQEEDFKQRYWVDLEKANLNGSNMRNTVIKRGNFTESKLNNSDFYKSNAEHADLTRAELKNAFMNEADFQNSVMQGIDLTHSLLYKTKLEGSDLRSSVLYKTRFIESNLRNTDLSDSNLEEAHLVSADLQHANLLNSTLEGADFHCADLRDVSGLTVQQLCSTKTLSEALIDKDLRKEINDPLMGCPNKLNLDVYKESLIPDESRQFGITTPSQLNLEECSYESDPEYQKQK